MAALHPTDADCKPPAGGPAGDTPAGFLNAVSCPNHYGNNELVFGATGPVPVFRWHICCVAPPG
jgi:hypothetical protein